jgi:hypothetical protein
VGRQWLGRYGKTDNGWPHTLRAVRGRLTPATTLTRWWQAWSKAPPPAELQHLLDAVTAGYGLHLYLPP